MKKRAVISGGGIAGLALGFWLEKSGIETVIIERARQFNALGHYISLKGNGVEIIRQMGLEQACRAYEVQFEQTLMLTANGKLLRKGSQKEFETNLGGYLLLPRADLQRVLFKAVQAKLEIRYDTQIVAIKDQDNHVNVEFSNGKTETFDLVFGADGIHSRTRQLVFGDGFIKELGGQYIALTINTKHGLATNNMRSYFGNGQMVTLFPTSPNSVSAIIYHGQGGVQLQNKDNLSIKTFLLETYKNFAPEVQAVFASINEQAFVFVDIIGQVKMPCIVKGRIALLGDAAHCPTFMSGMGSSLALQGAQMLASKLEQYSNDPVQALQAYQSQITPIANRYKSSALQLKPMVLDRRVWVAWLRDIAIQFTPDWLMDRTARQFINAEQFNQALTGTRVNV
jgi:2-polyprenyl-6-methoxyphenol hydroxylase-like FAD-dependent oxidoreductase